MHDKGKDYIVETKTEGGKKKVEVKKSYWSVLKDYFQHHYLSTVSYGLGTFLIIDGAHKTYHGQFEQVKDEIYLGLILLGSGKIVKVANENPKKEKQMKEEIKKTYSIDEDAIMKSIDEVLEFAPALRTQSGKISYAIGQIYKLAESNSVLRNIKKKDGQRLVDSESMIDPTDFTEELVAENELLAKEIIKEDDASAFAD